MMFLYWINLVNVLILMIILNIVNQLKAQQYVNNVLLDMYYMNKNVEKLKLTIVLNTLIIHNRMISNVLNVTTISDYKTMFVLKIYLIHVLKSMIMISVLLVKKDII